MNRGYGLVGRSIHRPRIVVDEARGGFRLCYANREQFISSAQLAIDFHLQSSDTMERYLRARLRIMQVQADLFDALAERYVRDHRLLTTWYRGANGVTGRFE